MGVSVGYARVSSTEQDLQPQLDGLAQLGASPTHIFIDHGLTAKNRARPGLREAMAACDVVGAMLVVTKLDRLARSMSDLRAIVRELEQVEAALSVGGTIYDPHTPSGEVFFATIAMIAEFEGNLLEQRTQEGMARAKESGRLRGKQPKLSPDQDAALLKAFDEGDQSVAEMGQMFKVSRTSAFRALERARAAQRVKAVS